MQCHINESHINQYHFLNFCQTADFCKLLSYRNMSSYRNFLFDKMLGIDDDLYAFHLCKIWNIIILIISEALLSLNSLLCLTVSFFIKLLSKRNRHYKIS